MYPDYFYEQPVPIQSHGIYPIPFMPVCPMLANAYVPYQSFGMRFSPEEALEKGTLFPDLYEPYVIRDKGGKICPKG